MFKILFKNVYLNYKDIILFPMNYCNKNFFSKEKKLFDLFPPLVNYSHLELIA